MRAINCLPYKKNLGMNIICINQSFKMMIFKLLYNVTIGMILFTFFFYQITAQNLGTRYKYIRIRQSYDTAKNSAPILEFLHTVKGIYICNKNTTYFAKSFSWEFSKNGIISIEVIVVSHFYRQARQRHRLL